jgi:S-disulfanyl-L-cysteine oxidoreductase SoxD
MKRMAGIFWVTAVLVTVVAQAGHAQTAPEKTIWDGVYTEAQATRGQRTAQANCYACHSQGEWSAPAFIGRWSGRSVRDLHSQISETMPYDSPGRLTAAEYTDIVAYMLKLYGTPAGEAELPNEEDGLRKIGVTRPASR